MFCRRGPGIFAGRCALERRLRGTRLIWSVLWVCRMTDAMLQCRARGVFVMLLGGMIAKKRPSRGRDAVPLLRLVRDARGFAVDHGEARACGNQRCRRRSCRARWMLGMSWSITLQVCRRIDNRRPARGPGVLPESTRATRRLVLAICRPFFEDRTLPRRIPSSLILRKWP